MSGAAGFSMRESIPFILSAAEGALHPR